MTDTQNPHLAAVQQKIAEKQGDARRQQERDELAARRRREQQSAKVQRLYAGLETMEKVREVELPMMSAGLGESFTVKIRDVSSDELFASNLFPPTAATLIEEMIRERETVTKAARDEVGMADIIGVVAKDTFPNPQTAQIIAINEIEDVFACIAVEDPDIRFVMHEHEAGGNRVWIRRIRREDIRAIANAVWKNVEVDAGEAMPFPVSGDVAGAAPAQPAVEPTAERADAI